MTLNEYQKTAKSTAIYPTENNLGQIYLALKLNGEAGEVAELIAKRELRGDNIPNYHDKLFKELGDVLWYISTLAYELGYTLEDVAKANLDKIADRAKRGVLQGSGSER